MELLKKLQIIKLKKKNISDKPQGVRGRSSDNALIKKEFNWEPGIKLVDGLKITYDWIFNQILNADDNKFSRT